MKGTHEQPTDTTKSNDREQFVPDTVEFSDSGIDTCHLSSTLTESHHCLEIPTRLNDAVCDLYDCWWSSLSNRSKFTYDDIF